MFAYDKQVIQHCSETQVSFSSPLLAPLKEIHHNAFANWKCSFELSFVVASPQKLSQKLKCVNWRGILNQGSCVFVLDWWTVSFSGHSVSPIFWPQCLSHLSVRRKFVGFANLNNSQQPTNRQWEPFSGRKLNFNLTFIVDWRGFSIVL